MNDIAFKVIIKNDGIDDVIFKTLMLKGEKGDKGDAGGAEIDDSTTSASKTWSSNKIRAEIDAKPDNISELDDVDLDSISDEQLLGYNFTTGKWNNKTINASTLKYDANTTIKSKIDEKANTADLATVATSGEYNDLSNKPQFAEVATSGDYDDLINKPSIPPAQVNADWNASSGVAEILNKPTIPVVDQTLNTSSNNAISNSAVANGLSGKADASSLSAVATSGDYDDLANKPTIPTISDFIRFIDVSFNNVTIGATGYVNIENKLPTPPTDFLLLFAVVKTYSSVSTNYGAMTVNTDGRYLNGAPNSLVSYLEIRYVYIKR